MPDFARLRLVWEPRMLSITRIMIGLLFMEHGTAKLLDFPHQPTHQPGCCRASIRARRA